MCWSINKIEFESNPTCYHKIAEEDITVYKFGHILDGKFIPYFKCDFTYTVNSLNEEVKMKSRRGDYFVFIDEGYHSYESEDKALKGLNDIILFDDVFDDDANLYNKIEAFIIPKGSEYYENNYGEIVSSQLIWTGESIPFIKLLNKYVLENR